MNIQEVAAIKANPEMILLAWHRPSDTFQWAALSGLPDKPEPNIFRVDPDGNQHLEDFVFCYARRGEGDKIHDIRVIEGEWEAIYS